MNVLVTGAKGFVGKNLCAELKNIQQGKARIYGELSIENIFEYDIDSDPSLLEEYCQKADFVYNLAGVNRPKDEEEFMKGNFGFASRLLDLLRKHKNTCPIMISSSTQAELDNPYGASKRAGEKLMADYASSTGAKVYIYRFPNLFGKWCKPNYNSVVATFCHNLAHDMPIQVNDRNVSLRMVYIDDALHELIGCLQGKSQVSDNYCTIPVYHDVSLGEIVDLLYSFKEQPNTLVMPEIPENSFAKKLYSTYLSYLPKEKAIFALKMNCDQRGSFTELLKTKNCGQFSVNISLPGITKGEHWHHTKWEFFIVVSGKGRIQQRKVGTEKILNFDVSGDKIEAVHMLPGYTHNIINLSETENLVTLMWANEAFDPKHPDTYFLPVENLNQ